MTIKQESELCLITYFAVCGICIEEKGTEKWVNILRQIWQTMDNYWGGIVERTKIPSQIPKGDFQIKLRVPFIKKFYTSWESLDVGCRRLLRWLRIFRNSLMHLVEGGGRESRFWGGVQRMRGWRWTTGGPTSHGPHPLSKQSWSPCSWIVVSWKKKVK